MVQAATNVMDRVRVYGGYLMPYKVVSPPPPKRTWEESNWCRREEESNNNTQVTKSNNV